jgi:transposase
MQTEPENDTIYSHSDAERFKTDAERFKTDAEHFKAKAEHLARENELMREEIRLLRAKKFGPSSEQSPLAGQGILLFNEAEAGFLRLLPEPELQKVALARKPRQRGKRELDLADLPIRRIDYTLHDDKRICPECSGLLHEMDIDIRREIEYRPAVYTVIEHATHIYACRCCQKDALATPIKRADSPSPLFSGSLASASLMSQILCDKYLYHLPLYRQEAAFASDGLSFSRQTLANWVIGASEGWLYGIYARLKLSLVEDNTALHADETTVQVLKELGRRSEQKSYMWLYRTSGGAPHPAVIYEYKTSRSHEHPKAFLANYSGYLHADGYSGYHKLPDRICVVGCWAHARRKFDEALKAIPQGRQADSLASEGLAYINRLFDAEQTFAKMDPADRYEARQALSLPIAEALFEWAKGAGALPKSLLGKACHYLIEQRKYLMRVFEDGHLELSNNRAERSIKPFVLGRKNWLFSNAPKGAEASAIIFSIIETAKENRLSVYEYLKYLFEELPNSTSSDLERLMPWSDALPLHVKVLRTNKS